MPLMFHNGKPLFVNGKLAMSRDCCCDGCLSSPYTFSMEIAYDLTDSYGLDGIANCETITNYGARAAESMSFTSINGVTTALYTVGSMPIPSGDCDLNVTPHLYIGYNDGGIAGYNLCSGAHLFSFQAVLVQKGTLTITFRPHSQTFYPHYVGQTECVPSLSGFRVDYTKYVCVDDGAQMTYVPNWSSASYAYQSSYTKSIQVR